MKWLFFLFLNIYISTYTIDVVSCDSMIQVMYQGTVHTLELFNVNVTDMSRVCSLLQESHTIEISFEPNIKQTDTLLAWVFVDGELLQQKLVDEDVAVIVRKNPVYQYNLEQEDMMVSAPLITPITVNRSYGYKILCVTLLVSILFIVLARTVKY